MTRKSADLSKLITDVRNYQLLQVRRRVGSGDGEHNPSVEFILRQCIDLCHDIDKRVDAITTTIKDDE